MFLCIFKFVKYFNCYKRYTTGHLSHIYIFISHFSNISIDQYGWEIVDYLEISDNDIVFKDVLYRICNIMIIGSINYNFHVIELYSLLIGPFII